MTAEEIFRGLFDKYGESFNWYMVPLSQSDGTLVEELKKELGKGHFLYHKKIWAVAKCESNDDVLYVTAGESGTDIYYIFHLIKRLISVCIIAIFIFGMYGFAQTAKDSLGAELEIVETDHTETVSEEEFWNEINDYESMPQVKLDWHELEGFWEPDENDKRSRNQGLDRIEEKDY